MIAEPESPAAIVQGPWASIKIPGLTIYKDPADFKAATSEIYWRWPAMNFPVLRMLHLLDENSLMASYKPQGLAMPILIAGRQLPKFFHLAINNVPLPQVPALSKVLPQLLLAGHTELITTCPTAAALVRTVKRETNLLVSEDPQVWTYHRVTDAKPADRKSSPLPPTHSVFRYSGMAALNLPENVTRLRETEAVLHPAPHIVELQDVLLRRPCAAFSAYSVPNNSRFVVGDATPNCVTGDTEAQVLLFNRLTRILARAHRKIDFVLPQVTDPRRAFPGHVFASEMTFRKLKIDGKAPG